MPSPKIPAILPPRSQSPQTSYFTNPNMADKCMQLFSAIYFQRFIEVEDAGHEPVPFWLPESQKTLQKSCKLYTRRHSLSPLKNGNRRPERALRVPATYETAEFGNAGTRRARSGLQNFVFQQAAITLHCNPLHFQSSKLYKTQ